MNKKVLPLFLILPIITTSCHGMAISVDDAEKIVAKIEQIYEAKDNFDFYSDKSIVTYSPVPS